MEYFRLVEFSTGFWPLATGDWSLVTGHWLLVSSSASSKKLVARGLTPETRNQNLKPCFVNYLWDATLEVVSKPQIRLKGSAKAGFQMFGTRKLRLNFAQHFVK